MINLSVLYKIDLDDGVPFHTMWVEDAPHIRAHRCHCYNQALNTLEYLIKEELSQIWRVDKDNWNIKEITFVK